MGNAGFGCYFWFISHPRSAIIAGHLYYFWTVLHPLATGKVFLKTHMWVYFPFFLDCYCYKHKLVARWRIGAPAQTSSRAQPDRSTGVAFRGRSYRLNGSSLHFLRYHLSRP